MFFNFDGFLVLPLNVYADNPDIWVLHSVPATTFRLASDNAPAVVLAKPHPVNYKMHCLELELDELRAQLNLPKDQNEEDLINGHIKRLHRYNELKDLAQSLIGKLALIEGKTTKDLYPRFNLDLDD